MSTAELKIDLINKIASVSDVAMLEELMQLLKFHTEKNIYLTIEDDKKAISEAKIEIMEGKVINNEDLQKEIKTWLKK